MYTALAARVHKPYDIYRATLIINISKLIVLRLLYIFVIGLYGMSRRRLKMKSGFTKRNNLISYGQFE